MLPTREVMRRRKECCGQIGFDKTHLLDSVRLLFEMNIFFDQINKKNLTEEQKYLLVVYREILRGEYRDLFSISSSFSEKEIDQAVRTALEKLKPTSTVDYRTIVFHGIHQFTPVILRAIEQISRYRRVVMLFNYQQQYKEIYQTWLDVYSCFDLTIKKPDRS